MTKIDTRRPQAASRGGRYRLLILGFLVASFLAMLGFVSGSASASEALISTPHASSCDVRFQNLDAEADAAALAKVNNFTCAGDMVRVTFTVLKAGTSFTFSSSDASAGYHRYNQQRITNVRRSGPLSVGPTFMTVRIPACGKVQVDLTTGVTVRKGGVPQFTTYLAGGANVFSGACTPPPPPPVVHPAMPSASVVGACVPAMSVQTFTFTLFNDVQAGKAALFSLATPRGVSSYSVAPGAHQTIPVKLTTGQTASLTAAGMTLVTATYDEKCTYVHHPRPVLHPVPQAPPAPATPVVVHRTPVVHPAPFVKQTHVVHSAPAVPTHFGSGTGGQALALLGSTDATPPASASAAPTTPTVAALSYPQVTAINAAEQGGYNWLAWSALLLCVLCTACGLIWSRRKHA